MKRGDVISNDVSKALVRWIVDYEVGVEFDNGELGILDLKSELGLAWKVKVESSPVYQTSVDHMTDDQLRASIDLLRNKRMMLPPKPSRVSKSKTKVVKEVDSPEQIQLKNILGSMSAEKKLELQRKLGLVD